MKYNPLLRSRIMRAIKDKNTKPEIIVRGLAHGMGYRYRLYRSDLPGKPDLTFPGLHKVIFINGCFWHGHACKRGKRIPKRNQKYWMQKISKNKNRDKTVRKELNRLGWQTMTIWECKLNDIQTVSQLLNEFLARP